MPALELTWYGADLRTGAIAEELPSLRLDQPISLRIGAPTSGSMSLALAGAPAGWEAAVDPGRTMLVAVDTLTGQPLWSGIVLRREGGSGPTVRLQAATPEAYLDRRYPGDYTATATDASTVMAALAAPALTSGLPLTVDAAVSGATIDYTMADADDRTILSALQEISALAGGPEWTIDTVWADAAQTRFQLYLRIRSALGSTSGDASFDMPGCIASYSLSESYERGKGATRVVARGDQANNVRATSGVHTADSLLASGWALWEHRWTPAQGITDTAQLDQHATEALALMGTGTRAWSVEAVASAAPRLGTSWDLGDTVSITIDSSPRHPAGIATTARAYAWTLDPSADRVAPILLEDE
ncbi:siphovirus ReqiPepy6 Gp37-like family protein [Kitasatospora sp. A2-31]|uniref:siphovirus ReqiPepy6 Gp37-like family protein n=1 Tax=Kitasatospora sp. A2-31 TaxID=2916414 RepID=UPI001EED8004|nr:siphovirus ReqiPepy6 Gp37-like family protein [Kitasatospora sp. A2-31]MCG6499470.1 siphovirus ReqiPepy6 Gp37-like family protein [Kitasatospora sp. A2-31]